MPLRVTDRIAPGTVFVPFNQPGLAANTLLSGAFVTTVELEAVEAPQEDAPGTHRRRTGARRGRRGARVTWIDWGVLLGKVVIVFAGLLVSVLLFIWMERKVIADLQTRTGPMRAGPRGVLLSLADGIKLFFKEAIQPTNADPWVYRLAPMFAMIPGFLAFAVVPFGPSVYIFGRTVGLAARRPVGRGARGCSR